MKFAQLTISEKLITEVAVMLDPWEAKHVALALEEYAAKKRKNKRLTQLVEDFGIASMFY